MLCPVVTGAGWARLGRRTARSGQGEGHAAAPLRGLVITERVAIASVRSRASLSARPLPLPLRCSGPGRRSITRMSIWLPVIAAVSAGGSLAELWCRASAIRLGQDPPLRVRHALFGRLVSRRLRDGVGGRVRYAISGGAPPSERLGHFFRGAGITVLEGYGLS